MKTAAAPPSEIVDFAFVDEVVRESGSGPGSLLPILHAIQARYRYLPEPALRRISDTSSITPADIEGVASFYSHFRREPVGRHIVTVCHGTACHVKGAGRITDAIRRHLGLPADDDPDDDIPEGSEHGRDTDASGTFTVKKVACLGCCTLAPVVQIDDRTYGHLTSAGVPGMLKDFLESRESVGRRRTSGARRNRSNGAEIRIGMGSCCVAGGSADVRTALERAVRNSGASAAVKEVGCVEMCYATPLVEVVSPGRPTALYPAATVDDAEGIVQRHFRTKGPLRILRSALTGALDRFMTDDVPPPVSMKSLDARDPQVCAFVGPQQHIATEGSGRMDPLDLDEFFAHEGFAGLRKCLEGLDPDTIIDTVLRSGLRGRGGAGFPTGSKWKMVRSATGDKKYVICNGDEGDPGAFMDRMLLESYPYRVLEGIAIAALAVGADEGILYIRAEYPLAVHRMQEAIKECDRRGVLGDHVLDSSFALRLKVVEGAGAFVCGEETALLESLEGRRGMPRVRPPYPAQSGLWGAPTLINNVETFAVIPWILRRGAEAFAAFGTGKSKGTKVFSLTGKVRRGGLIEVPMGVSLRQIVEEIGGGVEEGRIFKAVQIGGPSGGCVPAALADTPVDYEALTSVGAIMGSGGLVVMDDTDCMVDIARYFLSFTQDQSCGKCTFCRLGTRRMLDILDRICAGKAQKGDLEKLEFLSGQVKSGSLCGLGQTAPNAVLTTLRYFREEYVAHLEGRCPARRCKALVSYQVADSCIGCTKCAQECPSDAIAFTPFKVHTIDSSRCTRCDICRTACPVHAITVETG